MLPPPRTAPWTLLLPNKAAVHVDPNSVLDTSAQPASPASFTDVALKGGLGVDRSNSLYASGAWVPAVWRGPLYRVNRTRARVDDIAPHFYRLTEMLQPGLTKGVRWYVGVGDEVSNDWYGIAVRWAGGNRVLAGWMIKSGAYTETAMASPNTESVRALGMPLYCSYIGTGIIRRFFVAVGYRADGTITTGQLVQHNQSQNAMTGTRSWLVGVGRDTTAGASR